MESGTETAGETGERTEMLATRTRVTRRRLVKGAAVVAGTAAALQYAQPGMKAFQVPVAIAASGGGGGCIGDCIKCPENPCSQSPDGTPTGTTVGASCTGTDGKSITGSFCFKAETTQAGTNPQVLTTADCSSIPCTNPAVPILVTVESNTVVGSPTFVATSGNVADLAPGIFLPANQVVCWTYTVNTQNVVSNQKVTIEVQIYHDNGNKTGKHVAQASSGKITCTPA